jgi:hypothetical protein
MKKSMIVLFGLLLAVGWTSSAQAQNKEMRTQPTKALATAPAIKQGEAVSTQQQAVAPKANAPKRTTNFGPNATAVRTKQDFDNLGNLSWTDLQGNPQSTKLTDVYTDANGMMALLKEIYTNRYIPGAKYSAPRSCDLPYQTIQHGWNIIGTNYNDAAIIKTNSSEVLINWITIKDGAGNEMRKMYPWDSTLPTNSGWERDGNYWHSTSSSGGTITIPTSWLQNDYGYAEVEVYGVCETSANSEVFELSVGNQTYDYSTRKMPYSTTQVYRVDYVFPGTITPPDYNGYTICLVKCKDGINSDTTDLAPEYTSTVEELRNYFTTYFEEIQLLTDGMRVGEGGDNPGTMFSYSGDLNRFFLIGKGKMFYYSTIDGLNYDRAPFFSMYEEFSPVAVGDNDGFNDFYVSMRDQEAFPVIHDCMGVNYRQHYFAMSGKQGTTEYPINSLVFFVPDYRGVEGSDWRNYDEDHQPEIGMYIIKLDATATPDDDNDGANQYMSVVTWHSNLADIAKHPVEQSYMLYRVAVDPNTGETVTTCLTPTAITDTSFVDHDRQQYDDSYIITYYVIGTPVGTTNPDFKTQSNDDRVVIPGLNDFIGLDAKYESDYVVTEEKNYYRNYLMPKNLDELGQSGVTYENVGDGRTLILKRQVGEDVEIIAYLDLMVEGGKAYYRIRYVNSADSNTNNP